MVFSIQELLKINAYMLIGIRFSDLDCCNFFAPIVYRIEVSVPFLHPRGMRIGHRMEKFYVR